MATKKKNEASDGWHRVLGYWIYVEDGCVVRATKKDRNGYEVPAQVYFWSNRYRHWTNAQGTKFSTVKNGMYKGTYDVK